MCVTLTQAHAPIFPSVHTATLSYRSDSLHYNMEQKFSLSLCCISFPLISQAPSVSPLQLLDLIQTDMLVHWLIRTPKTQMGFLSAWERQSYSTWESNAQYCASRLYFYPLHPRTSHAQSSGRVRGRPYALWCYDAFIVIQFSTWCPLVEFSFTMSSTAHLFCLQSSILFIEKEDKNHFSIDLHKNHTIFKPLILHLKNTDRAISSLKQLTIVEQNIVPLYHQVSTARHGYDWSWELQ